MILSPEVIAAKACADAAKVRLTETASELQARLKPATLVHNAWSDVVDRGADAWDVALDRGTEALAVATDKGVRAKDEAVAFARARPGVAAAAATPLVAVLVGPGLVRRALRNPPPPPPSDPNDPPRLTGPIPYLETRP